MPQEQKIEPKTKDKSYGSRRESTSWWKYLLAAVGYFVVILLIIAEGITGWILIKNVKNDQNSIKSSQEETKNQYSSLEESVKENDKELDEIKTKITVLEENQAKQKEEEGKEESEKTESEENKKEEATQETSNNCDFSKEVSLRTSDTYDIFGGSEFDTVVCGYVKTQKEVVWDQEQENVYFVMTKYKDDKFRESIVEGIKSGNTVNKKIGDNYALNLGCKEGSRISGMQYTDETYLDDNTQNKILSSTQENPLSLIVSFDKHEGAGCSCCNLASKIRLY